MSPSDVKHRVCEVIRRSLELLPSVDSVPLLIFFTQKHDFSELTRDGLTTVSRLIGLLFANQELQDILGVKLGKMSDAKQWIRR